MRRVATLGDMTGQRRKRWATVLRRVLLAVGVAVVAVCIVSMHQLSSDHTLATAGPVAHDHAGDMRANTSRVLADFPPEQQTAPRVDLMVTGLIHSGTTTTSAVSALSGVRAVTAASTRMTPAQEEGGCAACSSHVMLMASCLLALTLVVASWLLRLPAFRAMAWARMRPTPIVATGRTRVRLPLTLVELSLRRT